MGQSPGISIDEKRLMVSFYERLLPSEKLSNLTGERLVTDLEWRAYTEWCCWEAKGRTYEHFGRSKVPFKDWIEIETHYALRRKGFEETKFGVFKDTDGKFSQTYREAKEQVLYAAVRAGIDFLRECEGHELPPKGVNLRRSLESYLA